MKISLMKLEIEVNIEVMLDYNVVNLYWDYRLEMLDYSVVMIEMVNRLVMLENIEVKLVKEMMYNHFDCLKVYKPVNLVNIVVMLESIEEMLVNKLVTLENKLAMHCFHRDHLENKLVTWDCMWEMLDCMKVLMDLMVIEENR